MQKRIEQRLEQLKAEFEAGQKMMAELESKQANLRDTLLRISGAIQVLEELNASSSNIKGISGPTGEFSEEPAGESAKIDIESLK